MLKEAVIEYANLYGIRGMTILLAKWAASSGGLDFVKKCVNSVSNEDVIRGSVDIDRR